MSPEAPGLCGPGSPRLDYLPLDAERGKGSLLLVLELRDQIETEAKGSSERMQPLQDRPHLGRQTTVFRFGNVSPGNGNSPGVDLGSFLRVQTVAQM